MASSLEPNRETTRMTTTKTTQTKESDVTISTTQAETWLLDRGSARLHAQYAEGVVNPIELAKALDVTPQMIYQYLRGETPRIPSRLNDSQKKVIDWDDAVAFVQKRLQKESDRQQRIDDELAGE
jgi:hypothetical protein